MEDKQSFSANKIPQDIKNLMEKFSEAGWQIYLVGGSVRDILMNRKVKDWDFTTDAKPEEILKLFPEGFYDNKFGTVGIPLPGVTASEKGQSGGWHEPEGPMMGPHPDKSGWGH